MMLDLLKSFVEGCVDLEKVQSFLLTNSDAEKLMRDAPPISPYTGASVDGFEYLVALDFRNNDHLLDAQDFLGQMLEGAGVDYEETDKYRRMGDVKYKSQPKWVDVDSNILWEILKAAEVDGYSGKSLVSFVKEEILKRYLFSDKPPKWMQNPAWPMKGGTPLKFICQEENFSKHDIAWDYKFCDLKTGEITVVTQTA